MGLEVVEQAMIMLVRPSCGYPQNCGHGHRLITITAVMPQSNCRYLQYDKGHKGEVDISDSAITQHTHDYGSITIIQSFFHVILNSICPKTQDRLLMDLSYP